MKITEDRAWINIILVNCNLYMQRWFSGRMLACHAGGPGSIPGRCNILFQISFSFSLLYSFFQTVFERKTGKNSDWKLSNIPLSFEREGCYIYTKGSELV